MGTGPGHGLSTRGLYLWPVSWKHTTYLIPVWRDFQIRQWCVSRPSTLCIFNPFCVDTWVQRPHTSMFILFYLFHWLFFLTGPLHAHLAWSPMATHQPPAQLDHVPRYVFSPFFSFVCNDLPALSMTQPRPWQPTTWTNRHPRQYNDNTTTTTMTTMTTQEWWWQQGDAVPWCGVMMTMMATTHDTTRCRWPMPRRQRVHSSPTKTTMTMAGENDDDVMQMANAMASQWRRRWLARMAMTTWRGWPMPRRHSARHSDTWQQWRPMAHGTMTTPDAQHSDTQRWRHMTHDPVTHDPQYNNNNDSMVQQDSNNGTSSMHIVYVVHLIYSCNLQGHRRVYPHTRWWYLQVGRYGSAFWYPCGTHSSDKSQSRLSVLVFHALIPGGQVVATLLPQTRPLSIPFKLKIRVRSVMVIEFCFGWQCVTRKSA